MVSGILQTQVDKLSNRRGQSKVPQGLDLECLQPLLPAFHLTAHAQAGLHSVERRRNVSHLHRKKLWPKIQILLLAKLGQLLLDLRTMFLKHGRYSVPQSPGRLRADRLIDPKPFSTAPRHDELEPKDGQAGSRNGEGPDIALFGTGS